jgi:hypothetical protein
MRDVLLVILWFIAAVVTFSGAFVLIVDGPTWAQALAGAWVGVKICGFCYRRLGA